jgi:vanillate O-demethylase ferredoxin subunit
MNKTDKTIEVLLRSITYEADDVISLDLRPVATRTLPAFAAGAHIELQLRNGLQRNYSLANPQHERHRYCVAVLKEAAGRGGSRLIHETLRAGDILPVSLPRNNFPLVETAECSLLIAGGIGITPIWCMVQRLVELGRRWKLLYAVRSRRRAAFLDEILALNATQDVDLHFDDESEGAFINLDAVVQDAAPGTHLYCCGPLPMLAAFERATARLPSDTVHVEYFAAKEPVAVSGGFDVVLARSGRSVFVPEHSTILDALVAAGIAVEHSCLEGVCGTCETKVLEGIPDHRDMVLSAQERTSNRTMMICCSGSKAGRLVLDL